jgi:hypothetical protein
MIAFQTATATRQLDAAPACARESSCPSFFDLLDELACGFYGLEAARHETFRDTIPAVCWAVPGAYAGSVDL